MTPFRRLVPRTLLARTFLLLSLLLLACIASWAALIVVAEHEPRAQQLSQLTISVVNLTRAALVSASPDKRVTLLRDLAESEGVHLYPIESGDAVEALPDTLLFADFAAATRAELGPRTRFAAAVNGQSGLWVSFPLYENEEDEYWLMLPDAHAKDDLPHYWLIWGGASLALALFVAWLIVSRVTRPLQTLSEAAREVGKGRHPEPIPEHGAIELRQLAASFNRMSADLKRIDAERAEVLAGISHDLRTPLTRLRLEAEMSMVDEAARQAMVDDIEQMDAILGQFLDYARGSDEAVAPEDVNLLLQQAAQSNQRAFGVQPVMRLDEDLPPLPLRRKALLRALANLIDNARKYGGGQIELVSRRAAAHIVVEVADRGPGIPPEAAERLKRPFTRLDAARSNIEGTGLGLAIVERVVRLHGGRLRLLPRPGGGLIARLELPIASP